MKSRIHLKNAKRFLTLIQQKKMLYSGFCLSPNGHTGNPHKAFSSIFCSHLRKKPPPVTLFQHNLQKRRLEFTVSLVGVTAYVLCLLRPMRKLEPEHVGPLCAKEQHLSLHKWIKTCQALTYPDVIASLTCHS